MERVVAIDWSGRVEAAGQRQSIWMAVWTRRGRGPAQVRLEAGRTRTEVVEELMALAAETPQMVVGVDFCFSYPAWFVRQVGARSAHEFWQVVAEQGESWLSERCPHDYFWGRHGKKRTQFAGADAGRMFRAADVACKIRSEILDPRQRDRIRGIAPKSPFQTGGAGSVGTGSLRGIPELLRLSEGGFSVWPFDAPRWPIVLEIYPRLLTGEVKKSQASARRDYLAGKQAASAQYAALEADVVEAACGSEDAFDALVSVMEMAARRTSFSQLQQATDAQTLLEGAVWGASA